MKKYLGILRNYFTSELEYRSNLVGLILIELVGMGGVLFIWYAAFGDVESVGGYSLQTTLIYYTLVPLVGFFNQVSLSNEMGYEIKNGLLSSWLLKPFRIWGFAFMRVVGNKAVLLITVLPFFALILLGIGLWLGVGGVSWLGVIVGCGLLLVSFVLNFLLDLNLTYLAFWLDDVWALEHFKKIAVGIFGGLSFPLVFVPQPWRGLFEALPFQYFYYVPIGYLQGTRPLAGLLSDFSLLLFWIAILLGLHQLLWKKGLARYEAFGS